MKFDLQTFEQECYRRDRETAARGLLALLADLDRNFGSLGDFHATPSARLRNSEGDQHYITRITSAISALLSDPELQFSKEWYARIFTLHRWLATLFAASPFLNADHILRSLHVRGDDDIQNEMVSRSEVGKFCALYLPDSEVRLDLDALWGFDRLLAVGLCVGLISPRFLGSNAAHGKRELILPWLTKKLLEIDRIEDLPQGVLHDVYMHCSYADQPERHQVKRSINQVIKKTFARYGIANSAPRREWRGDQRPVLLVVLEWFTASHSIYRTHSRTIDAARKHFRVVGVGYADCTDAVTVQVFDEFTPIDRDIGILDQIRQIQQIADKVEAQILYMPSVGMFPITMFLTNLRVAPIQAMALGHPATSHSDEMDYVVVEEDYVGDPACFSEKLLLLPSDGMPYRPSASAQDLKLAKSRSASAKPEVVNIAVCATTMKFNPRFLSACAQIAEKAATPVHFHFLVGHAHGLIYPQVERVVSQALGKGCTVYRHQQYKQYMEVINTCDMFINPFPFGNTNGIIDTVTAGLVGVCKTGPEVFEHIDEGLFGRLDFPAWLVARTEDEYVAAAARLASNHAERNALRRSLSGPKVVERLFSGRPEILGDRLMALLSERKVTAGVA